MPLRGQDWLFTSGNGQRVGLTKAQCSAYGASSAIQRVSVAICAGVRWLFVSLGGMRSSSSAAVIRRTSSLLSGEPGTMAALLLLPGATADSRLSSRIFVVRCAASGPWQAKQFFDKMGRMSRLKSMGVGLSARAKGSQAIVQPVKSSCEKKRYINGLSSTQLLLLQEGVEPFQ